MLEVLGPFEEMLRNVVPLLLAGPGVVLVLAGLFLWLGGLRWLKPLAAFVAASVGLACAWMFTSRQLVPMLCCTLIPVMAAFLLDKAIVAALGACLAGVIVLLFPLFVDPALRKAVSSQVPALPSVQEVSVLGSVEFVEELAGWSAEWGKAFWKVLPAGRKTAATAALVGVLAASILMWRWICALTCSVLGTMMIFSGMTLLLLSKGPQAIAYTTGKMPYLGPAAAIMAVLGTLLNRWLCPAKVKSNKTQPPKSVNGDKK
jgi:hypothetical protein